MFNFEPNYSANLPITEHRDEILTALSRSPVVIVCGDTGSGKTTQLPKMAFEWALAHHRERRIAITQPRRLAAVTMAERVATELKGAIGDFVGYRHRFGKKITDKTKLLFMTDGILLAETRFDPLLRAYDTIIVDEAHERSLNIDFLLGILKRILARRHDLKVIISSATLDAAHFKAYFESSGVSVPIVLVPGRLFPIEIGYRPVPENEERDLARDVVAAVGELPAKDDILVFLPGERDIRETAEALRNKHGGFDDIIPLLASLPASEQRRAFTSSPRRRIILATNVAETSVTIPGIRAVIDSGLARISRYVHRTQVQRLQIEPISQASAKQRAGRCGRLGPGICLRLYSEEDFRARDEYTAPEILRSSLAGVILTMLDLGLGDIEDFPFIDPPKPAMIREGLKTLVELGAIRHAVSERETGDAKREIQLTDIGRKLAKVPVEPRLARMLIAASDRAVLSAVVPLVAALACDDPKRRPIDEKDRADQAHAQFRVLGSDFLGTLKLWNWWENETKDLSQSKARKLAKANYLSYPKMREWRDLARQLGRLDGFAFADTAKDKLQDSEVSKDFSARFHQAILAGLLGRIGRYDEEAREYRGAFGLRFAIHPGSVLMKKTRAKTPPPQWVMAGELVDTARLFARDAAEIDIRWIESVAGGVCKHSYHSPEWDSRYGFVRATEQVTLYGLVIVPARRCDYSRINPQVAREVFIRRGLIDCEFPKAPPEVRANTQLIAALRRRAERSRRPECFDAEKLFAHFDRTIPKDIVSADALRKWLRSDADTSAFALRKNDWWPRENSTNRDFPDALRIADTTISLDYRHTPENPDSDGVTAVVRASEVQVLRLWRADWLVPGMLPEKLAWMLSTLPSALRRVLSPIDESVAILLPILKPGEQPLADAVRAAVQSRFGVRIPENAWNWEKLPRHLQMRFAVRDDKTGRILAISREKDEVLLKSPNREKPARIETNWVFGTIPPKTVDRNSGWATTSYPALTDVGSGVLLKLYTDPVKAGLAHEAGVTRLLLIALGKSVHTPFRLGRVPLDAALYLRRISYDDTRLESDFLAGAIAETLVRNRPIVRSREEFDRRLGESRAELVRIQTEITRLAVEATGSANQLSDMLGDERISDATADSVAVQLAGLIYRGFPRHVPLVTLRHYPRYLKGLKIRLERACLNPTADREKEARFAEYGDLLAEAMKHPADFNPIELNRFRWMLEEYRISLFAQELHTPEPISPKRLSAQWNLLYRAAPSSAKARCDEHHQR